MFQNKFGYLRTLPPSDQSFSKAQFLAYAAIDSMLRVKREHEIKTWIDGLEVWNDTTRYMAKYLYAVIDDHPAVFRQFMSETALRRPSRYLTPLSSVIERLKHRIATLWPVDTQRKSVRSLLGADIIVRGTITSIDSTRSTLTANPMMSYAVTMTVSDTIKGKQLPNLDTRVYPQGFPKQKLAVPPLTNSLRFEYLPIAYPPFGEYSSHGYTVVRDSAFSDANGYFRMQVGQEAIVFLVFMNHLVDDNFDYYNLRIDSFISNGALPILSGNVVRDAGHVWSRNTKSTYTTWRQTVQDLINEILH